MHRDCVLETKILYNSCAEEVYLISNRKAQFYWAFCFFRTNPKEIEMAKQRVFQRGKEYIVTGVGKRSRRLVFAGGTKMEDGREILLFRPLRKLKKHTK
jgi:hypothetical protein